MLKKLCLISLIILSNQYVYSAERKSTNKPRKSKTKKAKTYTYKLEKPVTLPGGTIIDVGAEVIVNEDGTRTIDRGYDILFFDVNGNFIGGGLKGVLPEWKK